MLEEGFLAACAITPTMGHTEEIVKKYETAIDKVFAKIAADIARGNPEQALKGPEAHIGFQRLIN